jgi:SOS response regulatory protein OraA/RecX
MMQKRKAMDLLARRGFPMEIIRRLVQGRGQDWDDQA